MNRHISDYVDEVMDLLSADAATKRRLRDDLAAHLNEMAEYDDAESVIGRMGSPRDMAEDLTDMLYSDQRQLVRELVRAKAETREHSRYEYKSKTRLLGVPLVHICLGGRRRSRPCVARGIIAIGDLAIGVVAVGGLSLGLIAFGGLSAGLLLAIGGMSVGAIAFGGGALGVLAMGGGAIGVCAIGGSAIASHIAIGGSAAGYVAIGNSVSGAYTIKTAGLALGASAREVRGLIQAAYPNACETAVSFICALFR